MCSEIFISFVISLFLFLWPLIQRAEGNCKTFSGLVVKNDLKTENHFTDRTGKNFRKRGRFNKYFPPGLKVDETVSLHEAGGGEERGMSSELLSTTATRVHHGRGEGTQARV